MSATHQYAKEAEELRYGFLAVKAKEAINKSLKPTDLNQNDFDVLNNASSFLNSISEGARLVGTKDLQGHHSSESLAALTLALHPLESLQCIADDTDRSIADFFGALAKTLDNVVAANGRASEDQIPELQIAASLFAEIYHSLKASLSESRRMRTHFHSI